MEKTIPPFIDREIPQPLASPKIEVLFGFSPAAARELINRLRLDRALGIPRLHLPVTRPIRAILMVTALPISVFIVLRERRLFLLPHSAQVTAVVILAASISLLANLLMTSIRAITMVTERLTWLPLEEKVHA